jgi:hypothetical protein
MKKEGLDFFLVPYFYLILKFSESIQKTRLFKNSKQNFVKNFRPQESLPFKIRTHRTVKLKVDFIFCGD